MAALAATFTPIKGWRYAGPENKSILKLQGKLIVTGAGGTNQGEIPASLFGLHEFIGLSCATLSDNTKGYVLVPDDTDGTSLLPLDGASNAPGDLPTGTYKAMVEGYSA